MTSGNLWNSYTDEIDDVDDNAFDGQSFKYKTEKIIQKAKARPELPALLPPRSDESQPP